MFLESTSSDLNLAQRELVDLSLNAKVFLEGPAGSGKTTAAVERALRMMADGIPANSILILVPQRSLGQPYQLAFDYPGVLSGGVVTVLTPGGLAQRMVDLFWPEIAAQAGFVHPDQPPSFLTLETAQYFMAHLVSPLIAQGFFESVAIEPNRLYSQVLDNLNKAALVGFHHTEIGERLKSAWAGEPGQLRVYDDVQECAGLFRRFCLEHNLLDYSLQVEIFQKYLWSGELCHDHLVRTYRHIIFDNLEEDTPFAHDIIRGWLPELDSILLIFDWVGGLRRFLGADPVSAKSLQGLCSQHVTFRDQLIMPPEIAKLSFSLEQILRVNENNQDILERDQSDLPGSPKPLNRRQLDRIVQFEQHRFYPQMLDWTADEISRLVKDEGYSPSDIAILSPFLSDALRFSVQNRLAARQIPVRSHRPSRALRDEPVLLCLLTLSALAFPEWGFLPARSDIIHALTQAIAAMDLVRAQLLVENVHKVRGGAIELDSFYKLKPVHQTRITYLLGERYEALRLWLLNRREPPDEFDQFLSRLFGELLSQPGFGFHDDFAAGEITANLIESIQKFRWVVGETLTDNGRSLGREYFETVHAGVISALYFRSWRPQDEDAVILSPAFTFLMTNQPVKVQFWLDAGSRGWTERLDQPLTQPYVLSRNWPAGRLWRDIDEVKTGHDLLITLVHRLLALCGERVYLGISELGEQGYENRGALLQAFQRLFLSSGQ